MLCFFTLLITLFPTRLCIVFLTFSCIGYAMPFILCAMICCCLPCIISVMGFREDTNNTRGATSESINTLPTYKFKTKKRRHGSGNEAEGQEGGIVAAGTDKERSLSAEDAVCCPVPLYLLYLFIAAKWKFHVASTYRLAFFRASRFAASALPSMHTTKSFVNFPAHTVSTRNASTNGSR